MASWWRSPHLQDEGDENDPSSSSAGIIALAVLVLNSQGKVVSSNLRWNQNTDRLDGVGSEESQPPM